MKTEIRTEIKNITPKIAKEMLKKNYNNRPYRANRAKALANEMLAGNWLFDAQPIRFDGYQRLLDGQHRLNAVILSAKPQDFLIVTGVNDEAFKVMDTGSVRSLADALHINGEKNSANLSSSIKLVTKFEGDEFKYDGKSVRKTTSTLLAWLEKNPDFRQTVERAQQIYHSSEQFVPVTMISALLYVLSKKNVSQAEEFVNRLCNGLGLKEKEPVLAARRALIKDKMDLSKLPMKNKLALTIKAWNKQRKNVPLSKVSWNPENEDFPTAV